MRTLIDILASLPVIGILGNILTGKYGWKTPVALIAQLALQTACAALFGFGVTGTLLLALPLIAANLFIGLVIGMMPLSGMGPHPMYRTAGGFLGAACGVSLVYGGALTAAILGIGAIWATGSFLTVFALSLLGGTCIHLFGVALPIYQVERRHEERLN